MQYFFCAYVIVAVMAPLADIHYVTSPAIIEGLIIPPKMYNRFVNQLGIKFRTSFDSPNPIKKNQVFAIEAPAEYWGLLVPPHLVEEYLNRRHFELNYNGDFGVFEYPFGGFKIKDFELHGASDKDEEEIRNIMIQCYTDVISYEYIGYDENSNHVAFLLDSAPLGYYTIVVFSFKKEEMDNEPYIALNFRKFYKIPVSEVKKYVASKTPQGIFNAIKKCFTVNNFKEAHKYALQHKFTRG